MVLDFWAGVAVASIACGIGGAVLYLGIVIGFARKRGRQ